MAITLQAVASRRISQCKSEIIKSFFSNRINPFVFVMGYSCSDLFDISPQLDLIETESSEIFFLDHTNSISDFYVEDISTRKLKNPFQNFSGKRIITNTDTLVKSIWEALLIAPYQFKSSSLSWKGNITKWLNQQIEYSLGTKNHLSARLFYDIGEYEYSVSKWEQGIVIAQRESNELFFYSQLGNLGMAFNALGRYREAKQCLEASVNACQNIGNLVGQISQLQSLGNTYRNLGDFDSAIKVYKKAVLLAEKDDLFGLCTSLGNLASVYTQKKQPEEAILCLEKGLAIAYHIGNKQSEGSMLCSIGIAYFQQGNCEKALQYIENSIALTRTLGDKQGECMALYNLSNLNLHLKNFDECIRNATAALKIARKCGMRQSEGNAYYNIGNSFLFKSNSESAILNLNQALAIFTEIYGFDHPHTKSVVKSIVAAKNFAAQWPHL
jgi:tetratricopeptide (TPR) repeat protein